MGSRCSGEAQLSLQIDSSTAESRYWVSSISYRSRARSRPTFADLRELTWKAQKKNRELGVTGILLYDKGRFFQTIEGPFEAIRSLWSDIREDQRHTEIDLLSDHIIPARLFGGWDLLSYHGDAETAESVRNFRASHELSQHVRDLMELVLNGDDLAINHLIGRLHKEGWQGNEIISHLIEPTARALGDAWLSDDCSEIDLTIGISMLQLAGHAVKHGLLRKTSAPRSQYRILLATEPGEPHALSTSLLADLFTNAGWQVDMAFPDTIQALMNQLASQKPDALDIGMSDALARSSQLTHLRETVERSRFAAPDSLTVVSVGGRLFADAVATAENAGADYARTTTAGATVRIADLLKQKRQQSQ